MLVFENSLNRNLNYPDLRCKTTRVYVLQKWYLISYLRSTWESQDVILKTFVELDDGHHLNITPS